MGPVNDENSLKIDENNNKTEKNEKSSKLFKMYNIINFKTIRNKLTPSGNITHAFLYYKLMGPASILRLLIEQKKANTAISKKVSEKSVEAIEKTTFH